MDAQLNIRADVLEALESLELRDAQALKGFISHSFAPTPQRRDHILSVAGFCKETAEAILKKNHGASCSVNTAICSGLLHDIGYLPEILSFLDERKPYDPTGWHPIDGANYLRIRGEFDLAEYIEGHGNALEVAVRKGLKPFKLSEALEAQIVTFCDSQTGPDGERVSYDERLKEIEERKGKESAAYQAHKEAEPRIRNIIEHVSSML